MKKKPDYWITRGGKHIPIYLDPDKEAQIKKNASQAKTAENGILLTVSLDPSSVPVNTSQQYETFKSYKNMEPNRKRQIAANKADAKRIQENKSKKDPLEAKLDAAMEKYDKKVTEIHTDLERKEKQLIAGNPENLQAELKRREAEIKDNTYETGICLDKNGNEVFTQKGTRDYVEFTDEQVAAMPGNTLTHNHPKGTCFSAEDLYMFQAYGLQELRAVCGVKQPYTSGEVNKIFSLSRTDKSYQKHPSAFDRDYREAINKYKQNVIDPFYEEHADEDEKITIDKAERMINNYRRKWLIGNAILYGFKYREYDI